MQKFEEYADYENVRKELSQFDKDLPPVAWFSDLRKQFILYVDPHHKDPKRRAFTTIHEALDYIPCVPYELLGVDVVIEVAPGVYREIIKVVGDDLHGITISGFNQRRLNNGGANVEPHWRQNVDEVRGSDQV